MHPPDEIRPKWLTVAQLRRVLGTLPDEWALVVNGVGNLAVYRRAEEDGPSEFAGFIDFLFDGEYEGETADQPTESP